MSVITQDHSSLLLPIIWLKLRKEGVMLWIDWREEGKDHQRKDKERERRRRSKSSPNIYRTRYVQNILKRIGQVILFRLMFPILFRIRRRLCLYIGDHFQRLEDCTSSLSSVIVILLFQIWVNKMFGGELRYLFDFLVVFAIKMSFRRFLDVMLRASLQQKVVRDRSYVGIM